jgi:hypothetical protein
MRFALTLLVSVVALAGVRTARGDSCVASLTPQNTKEIFLQHAAPAWRLSSFGNTPLEVSATLRLWKAELARKLRIDADQIVGNFRRASLGFEEISRPGEVRMLMVRTRTGLRAIVVLEVNLAGQRLKYLDPIFPRPRLSSFFVYSNEGRPSFHISAFEDELDRNGVTGNMVGVITLNVPGLIF